MKNVWIHLTTKLRDTRKLLVQITNTCKLRIQYGIKQKVGQGVLTPINVSVVFGIRNNCLNRANSRTLYLFIRQDMKQIVLIIEAYYCYRSRYNILQQFGL
jgi:hypothetical protein